MNNDSRLDALRELLSKHEPTPDDQRGGHRYRYQKADDRVHMTWQDRAKALLQKRLRRIA